MSGPEFYCQLKQVKKHHRRYPNDVEETIKMKFLKLNEERMDPPEELLSQYLVDLAILICFC